MRKIGVVFLSLLCASALILNGCGDKEKDKGKAKKDNFFKDQQEDKSTENVDDEITDIGDSGFEEETDDVIEDIPVQKLADYVIEGDKIIFNAEVVTKDIVSSAQSEFINADKTVYIAEFSDKVKSIEEEAFENNQYVAAQLVIPGTVESVGEMAFFSCDKLTSVIIEEGVKNVGAEAFSGCGNIRKASVAGSIEVIERELFYECGTLAEIVIGEGIKVIEEKALSSTALEEISFPDSLIRVGTYAFLDTPAYKNNLQEGIIDGVMYYIKWKGTECIIPDGVRVIADGAPYSNANNGYHLESTVTLPETLKGIGAQSLICFGRVVSIPNSVEYIGFRAFEKVKIDEVVITKKMQYSIEGAFEHSIINNVIVEEGVTELADSLFYGSDVSNYKLPSSLEKIGNSVFRCGEIKEIKLPDNIKEMGECALGSNYFTSIKLPARLTVISKEMFECCEELVEVEFSSNITCVESLAFRYCFKLEKVILNDSLKEIKKYAFTDCKSLKEIVIPESVINIETYAFDGCPKLVIKCKKGSYAERYAFENGIPYEYITE